MNYKLEKFWNADSLVIAILFSSMNYKLEKFWNAGWAIKVFNIFLHEL